MDRRLLRPATGHTQELLEGRPAADRAARDPRVLSHALVVALAKALSFSAAESGQRFAVADMGATEENENIDGSTLVRHNV
jgi:hypothetical protein